MKVTLALIFIISSIAWISCIVAETSSVDEKNVDELIKIAHYEPVKDFKVSSYKNSLSFKAYGNVWIVDLLPSIISDEISNTYFKGQVRGYSGDETQHGASFTLDDANNYITGLIVMGNETYWLEAHPIARRNERDVELVIFKQSDIWLHPSIRNINCHTGEQHQVGSRHVREDSSSTPSLNKRGNSGTVYKLALLVDQNWQNPSLNPDFHTREATIGLFNDVDIAYGRSPANFGTTQVTWHGQRTNHHGEDTSALLNDLSAVAHNYGNSYHHIHWLIGHNIGGLAYVGTSCNSAFQARYRTGISGLAYWTRFYTVSTIAHELGHNRGADHDFTGGQCSVMSYCQTATVHYFTQKSVNEMRAASCS